MNTERMEMVERSIFSPEFYRQNYPDLKSAAASIGIPVSELVELLHIEYETTLREFLISMRLEDVKEHLCQENSREPLGRLASMYGFRSGVHLLWHFIRQEKCTIGRWNRRMGVLPPDYSFTDEDKRAPNETE